MDRPNDEPGHLNAKHTWVDALSIATDGLLLEKPGRVFHAMSRDFEATLIRSALAAAGGCRLEAARLLGIHRATISRRIDELGLEPFANRNRPAATPKDRLLRPQLTEN